MADEGIPDDKLQDTFHNTANLQACYAQNVNYIVTTSIVIYPSVYHKQMLCIMMQSSEIFTQNDTLLTDTIRINSQKCTTCNHTTIMAKNTMDLKKHST